MKRFCSDICDTQTLKSLYYALVQSHIDYCSVVWSPIHNIHIDKIERILRQFTMFALNEYPTEENNLKITSYSERLTRLKMFSIKHRRTNSLLFFIYDIINNNINCPMLKNDLIIVESNYNLRHSELIRVNDSRLKLLPFAPLNQMCKLVNKIPNLFNNNHDRNNSKSAILNLDSIIFE